MRWRLIGFDHSEDEQEPFRGPGFRELEVVSRALKVVDGRIAFGLERARGMGLACYAVVRP